MPDTSTDIDAAPLPRRPATTAEVAAALEAMEPAATLRLRSYARYRMRGLGGRAAGRTHEDLLGEAYTATLAGQRRWYKDAVDFVGHLCGAMRSISSHWAELKAASTELVDGERMEMSNAASAAADAERDLTARQEVQRIRAAFAGDLMVLAVIDAFHEGLKGPEVQARLGIGQTEFETIVKRLRRGVERMQRRDEP